MRFPYSSIISLSPHTQKLALLRRPEIPITIAGPAGSATYIALVDTGADNTIFPLSVAEYLGISVDPDAGPAASGFGGYELQLLTGSALLSLESGSESLQWNTSICFFDFDSSDSEVVVLGHAGFLEYFTATFDGKLAMLNLVANNELPTAT